MTVEIEIIDRIYHNIEEFCGVNSIDIKEYMSNAIIERYNLDRYGDLNERLSKKEKNTSDGLTKEEKNDNCKSHKTEETKNNTTDEIISSETMKESSDLNKMPNADVNENAKDTTEAKPQRIRRTLKTK